MSTSVSIAVPVLLRVCVITASLLTLIPATLKASVVFDWPASPGWTAGSPTAGQTFTQNFTSVNPNDITVDINNSGNGAQGMNFHVGYPQISASPVTGGFTGVDALQLYVSSSQSFGTYIRTTITFDTPVINLSFQLWDVDAVAGQFVDKISNIQAIGSGGITVGPDLVTSAVAGYNTISGTGLSTVVLGTANANNSTNQGTINVTFNGPITQFSFDWSNNDPALGQQAVALGPLTYTPVPEHNGAGTSLILCLTAILFERLRRSGRLKSVSV